MFYKVIEFIVNWGPAIGTAILMLNAAIFIHELGHFWVGRWRGVKIERFAIWFGPAIWKKVINGVEWRLGCIPLGGYVAFPELSMESIEGKSSTPAEQLKPMKASDKIPILFAGSIMNVVLGFAVATLLWQIGEPCESNHLDLKIAYVKKNSPEWNAGMRPGDTIKSINGTEIKERQDIKLGVVLSDVEEIVIGMDREGQRLDVRLIPGLDEEHSVRTLNLGFMDHVLIDGLVDGFPAQRAGLKVGDEVLNLCGEEIISRFQFIDLISDRPGQLLPMTIKRDGKEMRFEITPKLDEKLKVGRIGVIPGVRIDQKFDLIYRTPWEQVSRSVQMMYKSVKALVNRKVTKVGVQHFSGPVGIVEGLVKTVKVDPRAALAFLVMLNINLAIINLLPIPVLDGGHVVFTLIEVIRKKPMNQRFMETIQMAFVILLICFILTVTYFDIGRLLGFGTPASASKPVQPPPETSVDPQK